MIDTKLIFALGSGRCGTKALVKMFKGAPGLESHHEYCRYSYQREAVMYYMGKIKSKEMERIFRDIYTSAAYYSDQPTFLDSSHKLVWAMDVLVKLYPDAKFIHLVRDGRKVVSSFYYKLQIHDDGAAARLRQWADGYGPMPPPSEKYWWPPLMADRFERICHYWVMMNELIMDTLSSVPIGRQIGVRLEDLTSNPEEVERLTNFVGVPYQDIYWQALTTPDHVYVPINYELTPGQRETFNFICGEMMGRLGYDIHTKEYDVSY